MPDQPHDYAEQFHISDLPAGKTPLQRFEEANENARKRGMKSARYAEGNGLYIAEYWKTKIAPNTPIGWLMVTCPKCGDQISGGPNRGARDIG